MVGMGPTAEGGGGGGAAEGGGGAAAAGASAFGASAALGAPAEDREGNSYNDADVRVLSQVTPLHAKYDRPPFLSLKRGVPPSTLPPSGTKSSSITPAAGEGTCTDV